MPSLEGNNEVGKKKTLTRERYLQSVKNHENQVFERRQNFLFYYHNQVWQIQTCFYDHYDPIYTRQLHSLFVLLVQIRGDFYEQ